MTAVASVLWFRSLGEEGPGELPPSVPLIDSQAQMITRDFRHVETRMNRTAWILEAAVAEIFEKKARLQRVKVTYFGNGDRPVIVTGRRARVDLGNWNAELFGDVRIVGYDGSILKTRQLVWNNRAQRLEAPWPVKIRSRHFDVTGRRMEADVGREQVRIIGRVTSVVRPPAGAFGPETVDKEPT